MEEITKTRLAMNNVPVFLVNLLSDMLFALGQVEGQIEALKYRVEQLEKEATDEKPGA